MRSKVGWPVLAVISLVLLAISAAGCSRGNADKEIDGIVVRVTTPTPTPTPTPMPTPTPTRAPTPAPSPTPTPLHVCGFNEHPAPPELLQVEEPQPEEEVGVPFHVRGWGSTIGQENRGVAVAIVDGDGNVVQVLEVPPEELADRIPPASLEKTEFTRPFAADVQMSDLKEPTPFCLWVYLDTTEEGVPLGAVQVPLVVAP